MEPKKRPELKRMASFLLLLGLSALLFFGCGGRDGSSGSLPTGGLADSETRVLTKLSLAYEIAKQPMGKAAVFSDQPLETVYTSAVVTLTLADGRRFTMTHDGNGQYSCVVRNLPGSTAGLIEAQINQMTLKNIFDKATAQNDVVDAGAISPDTTFVTDMVFAFAEALGTGAGVSASELLAGLQNASLAIDVQSLKAEVASGAVAEFEVARQTYNTILTVTNSTADTAALIAQAPSVATVIQQISSNTLPPPVSNNETMAVKARVAAFIDAYLNQRSILAVGPYLSSADFLWGGRNWAAFLGNAEAEWATEAAYQDLQQADLSRLNYSVTPAQDFTGLGITMYKVKITGTVDYLYLDGSLISRNIDAPAHGLFVGNAGTAGSPSWLIFGDRQRIWTDSAVSYFNATQEGESFAELSYSFGTGGNYPIQSAVVTFPAFPEISINIAQSPTNEGDYSFLMHGSMAGGWSLSSQEAYFPNLFPYLALDGKVVRLTVTFQDNVVETYNRVVQIESPTVVVTNLTANNQDGSIDLSWRPPMVDEPLLYIEMRISGENLSRLTYFMPAEQRTFTIPAADLAFAGASLGGFYSLDLVYHTSSAQYAYRKEFEYGVTVTP